MRLKQDNNKVIHFNSDLVIQYRSYDIFGKPRDIPNNTSLSDWADTKRGFTGHEHLEGTGLIHMNGRAYDPNSGRFLSVDPFIQSPENSQSFNPYSYVMNNPLSGVDPSGYVSAKITEIKPPPISPQNHFDFMNKRKEDETEKTKELCENGCNITEKDGKLILQASNGNSKQTADYASSVPGSTSTNVNQSAQLNLSGGQLKGELENESQLGVAPEDAGDAFNKGLAASEDIPSIRKGVGKPKFKNEFAIGYQDKDGNNRVKSFSKFDDANEFAKQSKGGWLDATEQSGYITLYRTATYAKTVINPTFKYQKMRVNHVEGVIMNLAHEGYHAKKGPAHSPQLFMSSFGAVERYRERGN